MHYRGRTLASLKGRGFKANYYHPESGDEYWISGCRKDGRDALYNTDVVIDGDVLREYWLDIRKEPANDSVWRFRAQGKCR